MKIAVHYVDDTHAEITLTPSWLGRLFGEQIRRGTAKKMLKITNNKPTWVWEATENHVDDDFDNNTGPITRAIECRPVKDLPKAHVSKMRST